MVRLYLNDDKKNKVKYIDVDIWSFIKLRILSDLLLGGIVFVIAFMLGVLSILLVGA